MEDGPSIVKAIADNPAAAIDKFMRMDPAAVDLPALINAQRADRTLWKTKEQTKKETPNEDAEVQSQDA